MSNSRLEQLFTFLKESPEDPFLRFALAKEYEKMGQEEKALEQYVYLTEHQADYVGTYYHLGKWYERHEQNEKAIKAYEQGATVARAAGDQHALAELLGAKNMIEYNQN
ncbi:MAG: tetratricopeptide repeat protein [Bacteroidota bacterium]